MTVQVIRTVLGDISPEALGITMCHEHLLVDQREASFRPPPSPEDAELANRPVALDLFGWLQWNWMSNYDNLVLDSESLAVDEIRLYKRAGGNSIVDCTLPGVGRDPEALTRISRSTGVHIIMGTGYYVAPTHPPAVAGMTEEALTADMVREVQDGLGDEQTRAGCIGEIGVSWPMHSEEARVLRAAASAQSVLGCAVTVHPGRHPDSPMKILDLLDRAGCDIGRVVISHIDRTIMERRSLLRLARSGCFVEYDLFGTEVTARFPYQELGIDIPSDAQRLDSIRMLVAAGHANQILVSQDVASKHRTRRYGGLGYDHVLRDIVPWMPRREFDPTVISMILIDNPRRALEMPSG